MLDRSFLVANAQQGLCHIIYCSDGFCRLTGFSRAEVMQRPAVCDFLHGPMTSPHAVAALRDALAAGVEKHFEILYYRKDGTKFLCSEVIALIRSEVDDICLQIINFEDLSSQPPPQPAIPPPSQANNRLATRWQGRPSELACRGPVSLVRRGSGIDRARRLICLTDLLTGPSSTRTLLRTAR